MRIGMVTTSFPRHERDIAGRFVLEFAQALVQAGHSVEVLAPEPRQSGAVMHWPGVNVVQVPYLRPRALQRTFYGAGVPENLARDPLAWLGLAPFSLALLHATHARKNEWDACISHWALPCGLAASLALRGLPHLAVMHSADLHLLQRLPARRRLALQLAQQASALWFVSERQRSRFLRLLPQTGAARATLVSPLGIEPPAPIDSAARSALRRRHQLQGFSVLTLGRLVPIKGIDVAIRAVAGRALTLLVVGDGPERARLEALARELAADVRFFGTLTGAAKRELLQAADAFALPSRTLATGRAEGVPHALLEAMSHGLPIVASRSGGVRDLLADPQLAPWLVPADHSNRLGSALAQLRDRPALRNELGQHCRRKTDPLHWPRIAARAITLLNAGARA